MDTNPISAARAIYREAAAAYNTGEDVLNLLSSAGAVLPVAWKEATEHLRALAVKRDKAWIAYLAAIAANYQVLGMEEPAFARGLYN